MGYVRKDFFTKEQLARARSVSLYNYLIRRGYELKPSGKNKFCLIANDSMVIDADKNKWYWNSRGDSGGTIDFLMVYEKMQFADAVWTLIDEIPYVSRVCPAANTPSRKKKKSPLPGKLPEACETDSRVYAYLAKTRRISPAVINTLLMQRLLYEEKKRHNAVFVRYKDFKPVNCFSRGTYTVRGNVFRHEEEWSDKRYGFFIDGIEIKRVYVFEAAIDALSYATLFIYAGKDWRRYNLLALGGTATLSLDTYMDEHPETDTIVICTDNDDGGNKTADAIKKSYPDISCVRSSPPAPYKDWNDALCGFVDKETVSQNIYENFII